MSRHLVEYSNTAYQDIHDTLFQSQKDAVEFIERTQRRYKYIWLLEFGRYKRGANWVTCWIYYWWSPAVAETDWGECPDAGWGRPTDRKYLIEYQPLLYKPKRFAHLNVRASPTGNRSEAPSSQGERLLDSSRQQRALVDGDSEVVTC